MQQHIHQIRQLLAKKGFPEPKEIRELPSAGSPRVYFRIIFPDGSVPGIMASFNENISENIAQNSFTLHFLSKGLKVPEIIARDESYRYFLLEDLGSTSLFDLVTKGIGEDVSEIYLEVMHDLLDFQAKGIEGLDLDVAYPVSAFSKRAVLWDLNYFKYYFVKPHAIDFDENKLEDDFQVFADYLMQADMNYFNYRDFQSRNIMLREKTPWYIDFQGGRKGPLQYDVVSLLYQAKANLPEAFREQLLQKYFSTLEKRIPGQKENFLQYYNEYILFRLLQVLGAYGFRGKVERKPHFMESIPFALKSIEHFLNNLKIHPELPELQKILNQLTQLSQYKEYVLPTGKLVVNISSFSYKKDGIPPDPTSNGGGFVFDCRSLPNPYRDIKLRDFNGTQQPIINFLSNSKEVQNFLQNVFQISEQSIEKYVSRGFSHLQISFGCTGGRHRSVFSAEQTAKKIKNKYPENVEVRLKHSQIDQEEPSL